MGLPGTWEILLVLLVVLLLFGAKKIPEIAHGMGKAITEFKRGVRAPVDEIRKDIDSEDKKDSASGS